jgi:ABC-type multidrug transport system fused ATPase/permease subunit
MHLLNLLPWFIAQYNLSMDVLIARPWSFRSKFQHIFIDDILNMVYDIYSKLSLPAVVLYLGVELSFTNHAILADRLASTSRCLTDIGRRLVQRQTKGDHILMYFECLKIGREHADKTEMKAKRHITELDNAGKGWKIELRDVNFAYPKEPQSAKLPSQEISEKPHYVLKDFNFTFERGKTYSIVGRNGGGKTTLIQLLAGIYPPTTGQIHINDLNMDDFPLPDLRQKMSFLFQDFARYRELTALENILLGDLSSPDETRARDSAQATEIDFVNLGDTLHNLDRRGKDPAETWQSQLSGGQWQKIALARAFIRSEAELLVLDEPTSALDIEAEYRLFKMILERRRGKTTVFVTHRLNTTRIADCILFLKEGRIVEKGSHDELMELGGEYARLFRMQVSGFDELVMEAQ